MVGVNFTQHGTGLFFIINFPPLNLVLSFLFKVGMVVYEVAAEKNMIFKIRTCWSWWYKLREANYKWGKDDALFKTLDIYFMSSVCPFSRKANLLPSTFGSLDCEQRGQSQVTLSLRCRACKGRVVLRHCNRGDSLPPPEQCCEKQSLISYWKEKEHIARRGWGPQLSYSSMTVDAVECCGSETRAGQWSHTVLRIDPKQYQWVLSGVATLLGKHGYRL